MYMHKNGVEYYLNFLGHLKELIANKGNKDIAAYYIKGEFQTFSGRNTIEVLNELHNHAKNIKSHIESETTILKNFIDNIHKTMNTSITSKESEKIFALLSTLKNMDKNYSDLEHASSVITNMINRLIANCESMPLNNLQAEFLEITKEITNIYQQLKNIYSFSKDLTKKLYELIIEIKKESELIKKEEQIAEDFQRNLMSWF